MTTIYKYPLETTDCQFVPIPIQAAILCVQVQNGAPFLWAHVDPKKPLENRCIRIFGTGNPIDESGTYIGTYQLQGGALVFHVFDCTPRLI